MKKIVIVRAMDGAVTNNEVFAKQKLQRTKLAWMLILFAALIALSMTACDDETPPPENQAPTANAGSNKEHDIAGGNLVINGGGTDTDGTIKSYAWTCIQKPEGEPTVTGADTANLTITSFPKVGEYKFQLIVTDNSDAPSAPSVVTVNVYRVASTTLTIGANSFSTATGANLDFTPSYSSISNPTDFNTGTINSCLTYTIKVVNHEGNYTQTWNSTDAGFNGKILPSDKYETDLATFTQTFYNNGSVKGTRVLKAMVYGGKFEYFGDTYASSGSVPAISGISISRKITSE